MRLMLILGVVILTYACMRRDPEHPPPPRVDFPFGTIPDDLEP